MNTDIIAKKKSKDSTRESGYNHVVVSNHRLDTAADRLPVLFPHEEDLIHTNVCHSCDCAVGILSWGLFVRVFDAALLLWWLTAARLRLRPRARSISTGRPHRQVCLTNPAWWALCSGNWTTLFHLLSYKPLSSSEHVSCAHKQHGTKKKRPNPDVWTVFTAHHLKTATAKFTEVCCRFFARLLQG